MGSGFGLIVSLGLLASIGSGAGSFSVLIGAASQRLPAEARGKAAGIVNAGGSFGQFVFAPVAQALIQALGWMAALWTLAAMTLAALPLVRTVAPRDAAAPAHAARPRVAVARARRRVQGPQLPAAERRVLHLRLPHRVPGHAPAAAK